MPHRPLAVRRSVPIAIVGAPPLVVSTGAPGARGEVLAYADRVDKHVRGMRIDVEKAIKATSGKTLPPDQYNWLIFTWPDFNVRWKSYYAEIQEFDLFGDSPSQAWEKIESYEGELQKLHEELKSFKIGAPITPLPKDLEDPDSVKSKPSSFLAGWWKPVLLGTAMIAATGFALSQVNALRAPAWYR